jgi:tetratricopeptide (TPR) repeat protein
VILCGISTSVAPAAYDTNDPDQLYARREQLQCALEAAALWNERLQNGAGDFEAAWKLARASYWLGSHVAVGAQRMQYQKGVEAAKQAIALDPRRPEGHFWMAANMGALAELLGPGAGLKYRGAIKKELQAVLRIDPGFQRGAADRALGRWYLKVPRLFGGSKKKAIEHMKRSLAYDPESAASRYFLAETYLQMNRDEEARRELERVLDASLDPDWGPETREFQRKARRLLDDWR